MLHQLCGLFLPQQAAAAYKTSTSGSTLDCNALPRFVASRFTDQRIWRKRVNSGVDRSFCIVVELVMETELAAAIAELLGSLAHERGLHVYGTESDTPLRLLLCAQRFASGHPEAIARAVKARAGVVQIRAQATEGAGTGDACIGATLIVITTLSDCTRYL